jgi:hypothetical protein
VTVVEVVRPSPSSSLEDRSSSESTKIGTGAPSESAEERETERKEEGSESMRRTKSYGGETKKALHPKTSASLTLTAESGVSLSQRTLPLLSRKLEPESITMVSCTTIDPEKSQKIVMPVSPRQQQQQEQMSMRTSHEDDKKQRLRFLRMRRHTVSSSSSVRPTPEEATKWSHSFNIMMGHKCEFTSILLL